MSDKRVNYDYVKRVKRFAGTNNISFVPAKLRQIMAPTGDIEHIPNGTFIIDEHGTDCTSEDGKLLVAEH